MEGIPPDQQRLIFSGMQLEDGKMLYGAPSLIRPSDIVHADSTGWLSAFTEYDILPESTLHVGRVSRGAPARTSRLLRHHPHSSWSCACEAAAGHPTGQWDLLWAVRSLKVSTKTTGLRATTTSKPEKGCSFTPSTQPRGSECHLCGFDAFASDMQVCISPSLQQGVLPVMLLRTLPSRRTFTTPT